MIKKGLYYVEKNKELIESQVNNIKEKLIKFKNEINNRIKKDLITVSKILDICLMNMKMNMKISDICLIKMN